MGVNSILYQQIGKLSQGILEGLGLVDSTYLADKKPIQEITSPSLKAIQYYELAKWQANSNLKREERLRYLNRAIELDSTFAAAYHALAGVYYEMRQFDKEADAITKAYLYADRAPAGLRDEIYAHYTGHVEHRSGKNDPVCGSRP